MKKINFFIGFFLLVSLFYCKKDQINPCDADFEENLPVISLDSVFTDNGIVTVKGVINSTGNENEGISEYGIVWNQGTTPSLSNGVSASLGATFQEGPFTISLDSIENEVFLFRVYATNCTGTSYSQNTIEIDNQPSFLASFTTAEAACLGPCSISFTNTSIGATSYEWDFGDGNISTEISPEHMYTTPGRYTVKLTAINGVEESIYTQDVKIQINTFVSTFQNFNSFGLAVLQTGSTYRLFGTKADFTSNRMTLEANSEGVITFDAIIQSSQTPSFSQLIQKHADDRFVTQSSLLVTAPFILKNYIELVSNSGASSNRYELPNYSYTTLISLDNGRFYLGGHHLGGSEGYIGFYAEVQGNGFEVTQIIDDPATGNLNAGTAFRFGNRILYNTQLTNTQGQKTNRYITCDFNGNDSYTVYSEIEDFLAVSGVTDGSSYFYTLEKGTGDHLQIRAYSFNGGAPLWTRVFSGEDLGQRSLIYSTDGSIVVGYVKDATIHLEKMDAETGSTIWESAPDLGGALGDAYSLIATSDGGYAFTGTLDGFLLLAKVDFEGQLND